MSIEIGMAIGQEVGSSVELFSIGGSDAHRAQLSAGLEAAGVTVVNAPKGHVADFAMANAVGYATPKAETSQPSPALKLGQSLG